jgi:hypothetical protein
VPPARALHLSSRNFARAKYPGPRGHNACAEFVTLGTCVSKICQDGEGREIVGYLVLQTVSRPDPRPQFEPKPEQLIEAAPTDLAAQGQAP